MNNFQALEEASNPLKMKSNSSNHYFIFFLNLWATAFLDFLTQLNPDSRRIRNTPRDVIKTCFVKVFDLKTPEAGQTNGRTRLFSGQFIIICNLTVEIYVFQNCTWHFIYVFLSRIRSIESGPAYSRLLVKIFVMRVGLRGLIPILPDLFLYVNFVSLFVNILLKGWNYFAICLG